MYKEDLIDHQSSCSSNYLRLPLMMLSGVLISDKDLPLNNFLTSDMCSLNISKLDLILNVVI